MIAWIIVLGSSSLLLAVQLLRYRKQLSDWAGQLENTEINSNLRLGTDVNSRPFLRLARAVNGRLEKGQQARIHQENMSRELKHAISCVSHDIRTPLTGAAGYLQLLEGSENVLDPARQKEYLAVVRRRLDELEKLLEELFLFTRLSNEEYTLEPEIIQPFPVLCDALASFYGKLTGAGIEPELHFPEKPLPVRASAQALARIFRNLIQNALYHGSGSLIIRQAGAEISFANPVSQPDSLDAARLFEPFYRSDPSRHSKGTGLGLASVKGLMEKMGGGVSASLDGKLLTITLRFREPAGL